MTISPTDKALDQTPYDLILETRVESAAQFSSPELHTTERQIPQPGAEGEMKPKDRPAARAGPMHEHLEEPILIDVSIEEPEIAGANARGPSPEYEDQEGTAGGSR